MQRMARYELEGAAWEITQSDGTLIIVSHPPRGKPTTTTRRFVSASAATTAMSALIARQIGLGYQIVEAPIPPEPRGESSEWYPRAFELEAAIARDPYAPDGYRVYGDWLQAHGDPRGELIALQ